MAVEPKVFDLLTYVVKNRDRVVSRDDLMAAVWDGRIVSESALTTCVNAVRSAVSDSGEAQRLIKTLPRKGIRFVGAVREDDKCTEARTVEIAQEQLEPELALPDRPSVAVLSFVNMSGEPEQEYFADGMAEEIITALSRCSWLFVIARNSSFTYKGKTIDVRQVARELGVRYVLQGRVAFGGKAIAFDFRASSSTQRQERTSGRIVSITSTRRDRPAEEQASREPGGLRPALACAAARI